MDWQPIGTAPREGEFLAYVPYWKRVFQVRMSDLPYDGVMVIEPTRGRIFAASLWMPVPELPAAQSDEVRP